MTFWDAPAVVLAFIAWLYGPPVDLSDISQREALRRQLLPKSTQSLTNDDVAVAPRRPVPVTGISSVDEPSAAPTPAASDAAKKTTETHDQSWWHDRVKAAHDTLERDQLLAASLQNRVDGLWAEWSARDDPGQRQALWAQRDRAMQELETMKDQIVKDTRAISDIEEEARRQNVPPGWLR